MTASHGVTRFLGRLGGSLGPSIRPFLVLSQFRMMPCNPKVSFSVRLGLGIIGQLAVLRRTSSVPLNLHLRV